MRGVDGFTIDTEDCLLVTAHDCILRIKISDLTCIDEHPLPVKYPASCGFCGKDMNILAVVTSRYKLDAEKYPDAGLTYVKKLPVGGRLPYLFG